MSHCTWPRCPCKATGIKCTSSGGKSVSKKSISKPKPIPKVSEKGKVAKAAKKELVKDDMVFYLNEVWAIRPHRCECCKAPLYEPVLANFHHILAKRKTAYPQFRHCMWNIMIVCKDCHNTIESHLRLVPYADIMTSLLLKLYYRFRNDMLNWNPVVFYDYTRKFTNDLLKRRPELDKVRSGAAKL